MIRAALILALTFSTAPALAQSTQSYSLTAADASSINLRRPHDWKPYPVNAGDVFQIDKDGLIYIPSVAPAIGGGTVGIEDLQPRACQENKSC